MYPGCPVFFMREALWPPMPLMVAGGAERGPPFLTPFSPPPSPFFPPHAEGVYGDVMRVKILFNKKENALVQMADATQAQLGECFRRMCGAWMLAAKQKRGFDQLCSAHRNVHKCLCCHRF